jgi:hypothetical protein
MSEKSFSNALGIESTAEEALGRAGVNTLEQLSEADADTLATSSGIPVDRIRDWQHRARRATRPARRSPVLTGSLIAIAGLLLAVLLGWAMMSTGARKIERGEQLTREAESKLEYVTASAAQKASAKLNAARPHLRNRNWGSAKAILADVGDYVGIMEQVSADTTLKHVRQVREGFVDLERAVGEQSEDAMERLDTLQAALDDVAQPE